MGKNRNKRKPALESAMQAAKYSFDQFVAGESNRLAFEAARTICKEHSKTCNPLFIYGPSGVGKTHLLSSIANDMRRSRANHVVYCRGDDFTRNLISAIRKDWLDDFREKYRTADVFLLDDAQYVAGRDSTQEELFHTFNKLYETGKQIVLTADCSPQEMERLDEKLRSRFSCGLIAEIAPMDHDTKKAYLKSEANKLQLELIDETIEDIAKCFEGSAWEMRGVLNKICAIRNLTGKEMDQAAICSFLADYRKSAAESSEDRKDIL